MVRINLIDPKALADQHLIAEYNEILMLLGYVKRFPEIKDIPPEYTLGKGHIKFFKNKLKYIADRHEIIKKEMKRRQFVTNKTINLKEFPDELHNHWKPQEKDIKVIKERIIEKLNFKPEYYKYESKVMDVKKLIKMIKEAN